ncbi:UvrB/UvrC motif-containing protein [Lentibacillus sediminis]|uniref:UvrB/UvrC motif-containing protein n=1 Tax=Lentibacillus sediminis TaxID=1940529 RepID=UPI000C1BB113|nr:UvrB/UvrC motif-containing protein [Lentibacillus sediminis]
MECQDCHKRPATVHFSQSINGNKTEIHVCEVCAKENGYMPYQEEGYGLHHLITDLFNIDSAITGAQGSKQQFKQIQETKCPQCGMGLSEFKRIGKFGCASCYETFSSRLDPIFRRVHSGNTKHFGKIPKRRGGDLRKRKELDAYKEELDRLIKEEAFEEAAEVRDKIKALKGGSETGEKE